VKNPGPAYQKELLPENFPETRRAKHLSFPRTIAGEARAPTRFNQ